MAKRRRTSRASRSTDEQDRRNQRLEAEKQADPYCQVAAFDRGRERRERRDARLAQSPQDFADVAQAVGGAPRQNLHIDVTNVDAEAERAKFLDKESMPGLHAPSCDVAQVGADAIRKVLYAPPSYPAPPPSEILPANVDPAVHQKAEQMRKAIAAVSGADLKPEMTPETKERLDAIRRTQDALNASMADDLKPDASSDMSVDAQLARRLKQAQEAQRALAEAMAAAQAAKS